MSDTHKLFTITICGHRYDVEVGDPGMWSTDALGRSNIQDGRILLKSGMSMDAKHSTLLHEVIHQIYDLNDLPIRDNETYISVMAVALYSFLKDNPEAVKWLALE